MKKKPKPSCSHPTFNMVPSDRGVKRECTACGFSITNLAVGDGKSPLEKYDYNERVKGKHKKKEL